MCLQTRSTCFSNWYVLNALNQSSPANKISEKKPSESIDSMRLEKCAYPLCVSWMVNRVVTWELVCVRMAGKVSIDDVVAQSAAKLGVKLKEKQWEALFTIMPGK